MLRYATEWLGEELGVLVAAVSDRGIRHVRLVEPNRVASEVMSLSDGRGAAAVEDRAGLAGVLREIREFLEFDAPVRSTLDDPGTEFQRNVWTALRSIPRGETRTYGSLAESLGLDAGAARAVGTACGSNAIAVVIPCHRVLRSDGGLGGYRWGLERKRRLLEIEGAMPRALF